MISLERCSCAHKTLPDSLSPGCSYYKDTHKILGQTFNMLVLQDFEALTPNLLARTIETVEGGGIVVCLLQGMKSLRGLYSMSMVSCRRVTELEYRALTLEP